MEANQALYVSTNKQKIMSQIEEQTTIEVPTSGEKELLLFLELLFDDSLFATTRMVGECDRSLENQAIRA